MKKITEIKKQIEKLEKELDLEVEKENAAKRTRRLERLQKMCGKYYCRHNENGSIFYYKVRGLNGLWSLEAIGIYIYKEFGVYEIRTHDYMEITGAKKISKKLFLQKLEEAKQGIENLLTN